jgi:predicted alpha/beta hydrolase family esterase
MASSDDPYASLGYARQLAQDWGAAWHDLGARSHLNADSGLGDWPEGCTPCALAASPGAERAFPSEHSPW